MLLDFQHEMFIFMEFRMWMLFFSNFQENSNPIIMGVMKPHMDDITNVHPYVDIFIHVLIISSWIRFIMILLAISSMKNFHYTTLNFSDFIMWFFSTFKNEVGPPHLQVICLKTSPTFRSSNYWQLLAWWSRNYGWGFAHQSKFWQHHPWGYGICDNILHCHI